jgi:FkbM family methyltransferase
MEIAFSRYLLNQVGELYFATDAGENDDYLNFTRNNYHIYSTIQYALNVCQSGDKFVDIGANIGHFTLPLAKAGIKTLAVEALSKNFILLAEAIVKNSLKNVILVHAAAYSETDIITMAGTSAWGHIGPQGEGVVTPAISVDKMLSMYDFTDARLIKIDVEGSELGVLSGMENFLKHNTGADIIFEANALTCANYGYSVRDLKQVFESYGYTIYLFHGNVLAPRRSENYQEQLCQDFLATRNEIPENLPGFSVRNLTYEERVTAVLEMIEYPVLEHQAYAVLSFQNAPFEIRENHPIKTKIDNLLSQPSEELVHCIDRLSAGFD